MDRLLRAQGGGRGKASPSCREFDADLANAYVERNLTANETASYEQHLAACSPCRKSIVALTRMAQADQVAARTDTAVGRTQGESWVKRWLGALTPPQWAMAATAAIVLAITLPLILSQRSAQKNQSVALDGSSTSQPAANSTASEVAQGTVSGAAAPATNSAVDAAREPNASGHATASTSDKPASFADAKKDAQAEAPAPGRDEAATTPAARKPAESQPADQAVAKNDSPSQTGATAPATQPAAAEAPLPKIDPDKAKQLAEDKDAANAKTIKSGQTDGEARDKAEAAVRSEIAPPPVHGPRTDSPRQRRNEGVATGVPGRSFRESSGGAASAPRGASRKIGNHLFWLRGETWTDKDYDPNKDMPVVTIIRDSDVYRDLLAKDEKIKPFLTDFAADARVIFIFKGTVYKLIPQDGDR